ncbi:hypothetical protein YPPY01_4435, partial [Yersinia pestis PY-01]
MVHPRHQANT